MTKYSKYFNSKLVLLFVMIFILLILVIFRPLGLNTLSGVDFWRNLSGIQGTMVLSCYLLLRAYDVAVPVDKVGVPYLIVTMILTSATGIYLIGFMKYFIQVPFISILKELTVICIFPSLLFWIYFDRIFYSTYYDKANKVNKRLRFLRSKAKNEKEKSSPPPCITIVGKNHDNVLELCPHQLVYMMAQENYCQIFYLNKQVIEQKMFRNSLSDLFDQLREADNSIIRCHRTYVVNLRHVEQMSGNARGYFLKLRNTETEIPVSRNFPDIYLLKQQFSF